jgi:hypothetical protein
MPESRGYCVECRRNVLIRCAGPMHWLHLLLILITSGLWIPCWIIAAMMPGDWRCSRCGAKVASEEKPIAPLLLLSLAGVGVVVFGLVLTAIYLWQWRVSRAAW